MDYSVIIPARYASTRLPGKLLADIAGRPLVAHVVDRANESQAARVIVATDDERISAALKDEACEVCMTRSDHLSGSDRLAEVVATLQMADDEIVVNVQGDEPLIPAKLIDSVAQSLSEAPDAAIATAAHKIASAEDFADPNVVKVVSDIKGRALYFSRAPIPHNRDGAAAENQAWHHIGIYAYRVDFLKRYSSLQASALERSESLEQLRALDNGEIIMVQHVDYDAGIGVDTEQDLQRVRELFNK